MLRRDTLKWRVLVELAGQDRPMTVRELFDALDVTLPEALHAAVDGLYYDTSYLKREWPVKADGWSHDWDNPTYTVTWEGQEALRRLDAPPLPDTVTMPRTRAKTKRRWWPW